MKEDKLDNEIAASLKKKLVEASVPYQLGAWEGFQKKRAAQKRKTIAAWASGIAASLLLLAVGLNSVDFSGNENAADSGEAKLAESAGESPKNTVEDFTITDAIEQESIEDSPVANLEALKPNTNVSGSENQAEPSDNTRPQGNVIDTKALATAPETVEKPEKTGVKSLPELPLVSNEKTIAQVKENAKMVEPPLIPKTEEVEDTEKIIKQHPPLIAKSEEGEKLPTVKSTEQIPALAKVEEPVEPEEKEAFVTESDFPLIPKDKTTVGLGMGVSPGFGSVQGENQMATASTIGVGMLVDIKLPGKLTLGSGLGVNYLSQNAKQESMVMSLGNNYPQTEKLEVRQMQVEMPVFVKYPVTRSNSISIQAGFSNFYAVNENANQKNTVERQVAVYNNDAMGYSSLSMKQQTVTESMPLESKSGKFYPFATLNFGVNLRVLETKGANYVIMPFYNYQVKQVSGYGNTFGLFGASFKMNFGGGEK
ncbi:hypothetical protein [Algoriphagus resistens]|uniref:hypothetical protein n=1 Tax=Algoriphagus resistens TaxID=1750590 RepID=UPI000716C6EF|nr:hypothetical protein [Algoriphagus resistens]